MDPYLPISPYPNHPTKPSPFTLCSGSPGNERAGDNQNHLNDLNNELALLIGIERLDQLFSIYYFLRDITEENMIKNEFVL